MKKSDYNLMLLQNFILDCTHDDSNVQLNCEQLYSAALSYIDEDHVDGISADSECTLELIPVANVQVDDSFKVTNTVDQNTDFKWCGDCKYYGEKHEAEPCLSCTNILASTNVKKYYLEI
jgi:hypothetical protein